MKLPALISQGEEVYRCAGYGIPDSGELYLSQRGKVTKYTPEDGNLITQRVMRLRVFSSDDFVCSQSGNGKETKPIVHAPLA